MYDVNFLLANGVDVNKSLELFGDMDTYNQSVGEFIVSAEEKRARLSKAKNDKDMSSYANYTHSLNSDASYFGFTKLAEMAKTQEEKAKSGDVLYIFDHCQELIVEMEKSINIIKQYISGASAETAPAPATPAPAATPQAAPAQVTYDSADAYLEKTILVVDDSSIVRNFVKRIFSETYNIGAAENGEEAINIIKSNMGNDNIMAILLDLNMPKVSGFAVLDFMKENNLFSKMPVSIISGDSSKDTIDKAFTYPIVDMLGKPFKEGDVKSVIEKTIYLKGTNS